MEESGKGQRKRKGKSGEPSSSTSNTLVECTVGELDTDRAGETIQEPVQENFRIENKKIPESKYMKKKKEAVSKATAQDISNIILLVSGVIASVTSPVWVVSPKEAQDISAPLTNILERYNLLEKVTNCSDWTGLTIALGMTFIPKIIAQMNMKKEAEKNVKEKSGNGDIGTQHAQNKRHDISENTHGNVGFSSIGENNLPTYGNYF
jgi:hypothetical protein